MFNAPKTFALALLAGLPFALAACGSTGSSSATRGPLVLDGDIGEWRRDAVAVADERFVYLRFAIEGEDQRTLQANTETTRIAIDADRNPETGLRLEGLPDVEPLGVDLDVFLSPNVASLPEETRARFTRWAESRGLDAPAVSSGVAVRQYDAGGDPRASSHAEVDFALAPTYASPWFEARIGRLSTALIGSGIDDEGSARGLVLIEDEAGEIAGYSDAFDIDLPRPARDLGLTDVAVPAQQPGTLRVVSFNVLRAKPAREPEAFARLITALAPDVILFQEFGGLTGEELADWLDQHVGALDGKRVGADAETPSASASGWHAEAETDLGVAVASPHPISPAFLGPLSYAEGDREVDIRAVAGVVETPFGEVLASSVHLKCCGSANGPEDRVRMIEAEAIRGALAQLSDSIDPSMVVLGGDINLVGTRPPLDAMRASLDRDGTDLAHADPRVLGDNAYYTWTDPSSAFSPGRLDWITYSDSTAAVAEAFVLDLGRLTRERVQAAGLVPSDTAASDHLPVVVDLRPITPQP